MVYRSAVGADCDRGGTHFHLDQSATPRDGPRGDCRDVRELRAISHRDRKSDQVDAEKLARFARLDPKILRPITHLTVAQQEALTLIRARNLIVRLRTGAVNAVRGLAKPCGYRLPASPTLVFAKRSEAKTGALRREGHPQASVARWGTMCRGTPRPR
jgi:transposase